ncbi:MAG: hypothetical protein KJ687_11130, partial [Proteobacteria bacterium]|nr:hypothetical protein [Pseudomonadota bacterium]
MAENIAIQYNRPAMVVISLGGKTNFFGAGSWDFWVVKTDASGDCTWSRTFGGNNFDQCFSVEHTTDGGYVFGGYTWSFGAGLMDFWIVKTNANGDSLWSRTFGGSRNDICYSVQQTADGGYILGGRTESFGYGLSDFWVMKTDVNGDSVWSRTFGGIGEDDCHSVQQTADGGYIFAGCTESYGVGYYDFWLIKTDPYGTVEWHHTFGGISYDVCLSVQQTTDGGYICGGYTDSFGAGYEDFWLLRVDANGDSLWSRTFGGSGEDVCYSILKTDDDGYVLGGYTSSYGAGSKDIWLLKTDDNGMEVWSRTFGGDRNDYCSSLQRATDGGYILGGRTYSFGAGSYDFWLVKTEPEYPNVGYVTLLSPGPPDWGYRLHHVSGALSRVTFTDFCDGTIGSVGGTAAAGWTAANYADSIVFTTTTPLTSGAIDTFLLSHPSCSDVVDWTVGDSSG